MEDELARLRRALQGTDSELDLPRVFAESQVRALHAPAPGRARRRRTPPLAVIGRERTDAGLVEIPLEEPLRDPVGDRRRRRVGRRALAASLALAASVVIGVALGPSTIESPTPEPIIVGAPTATTPPTPSAVPPDLVERVRKALSAEDICQVGIDSTLGEDSTSRVYKVAAWGDLKTYDLQDQPLDTMQAAGIVALRDLRTGSDAGWLGAEGLGLELLGDQDAERIRTTSALPPVRHGEITRIEYLIDPSTWLPRTQEIWATSDDGEQFVLVSEITWLDCDGRAVHELHTTGRGTSLSTVGQ